MSTKHYGTKEIVTDGLLLCFDPVNSKSFNIPQNLLRQSENFLDSSVWGIFRNISVEFTKNSIIGPYKNTNVFYAKTYDNNWGLFFQERPISSVGTGKQYCSVYAKKGTAEGFTFNCYYEGDTEVNLNFNLANGTCDLGATIEDVGDGWYRCSIIVPAQTGTGTTFLWRIWPQYRASAGLGTYFWGAQLSNFEYSTDYIKTEAAAIGSPQLNVFPSTVERLNTYNQKYISYDSNGATFTRTSSTPKHGGNISATMSGKLLSSNFLYNDHTWDITFRINDRNAGGYDATEGWSALGVYRGYHSGLMYDSNYVYYLLWDNHPSLGATSIFALTWSLGNSGQQVNQGEWSHITVKKNGNLVKGYLNGVLTQTYTLSSYNVLPNIENNLHIGSAYSGAAGGAQYSYYSKSTIGQMKMYGRALSDLEIQQNFEAIRGRYGI